LRLRLGFASTPCPETYSGTTARSLYRDGNLLAPRNWDFGVPFRRLGVYSSYVPVRPQAFVNEDPLTREVTSRILGGWNRGGYPLSPAAFARLGDYFSNRTALFENLFFQGPADRPDLLVYETHSAFPCTQSFLAGWMHPKHIGSPENRLLNRVPHAEVADRLWPLHPVLQTAFGNLLDAPGASGRPSTPLLRREFL
jgi:hypothetical protein